MTARQLVPILALAISVVQCSGLSCKLVTSLQKEKDHTVAHGIHFTLKSSHHATVALYTGKLA